MAISVGECNLVLFFVNMAHVCQNVDRLRCFTCYL